MMKNLSLCLPIAPFDYYLLLQSCNDVCTVPWMAILLPLNIEMWKIPNKMQIFNFQMKNVCKIHLDSSGW